MATDFQIKITDKKCCHWCALGITKDRKKQLLDKLNYIAGQVSVSAEPDIAVVLKHLSAECENANELAAVTWVLGSWAAGISVFNTVKSAKVVADALKTAASFPMGGGGEA